MAIILRIILIFLLVASQLMATTYYIATNGIDGNSGTDVNHPWAPDLHAWTSITGGSTYTSPTVVAFNSTNIFTNIMVYCAGNNILFTSYGTSNAIITNNIWTANFLCCFSFTNQSGIVLSNLDVDFIRPDSNDVVGGIQGNGQCATVLFSSNTTNSTLYTNDLVINCRITGAEFAWSLMPYYQEWPDGFTNCGICNCVVSNSVVMGINYNVSDAGSGNPIIPTHPELQNCYIISNNVSLILGFTEYPSGFGIVPSLDNGTMIVGNIVHDCGQSNNSAPSAGGGGPGGIFFVQSEHVLCASNVVYNISSRSGSVIDGNGIGPDSSSVSNLITRNFCHDNGGEGFYNYGGTRGGGFNTFSFNVSSNNTLQYTLAEYSSSLATNNSIYNNTFISTHQIFSVDDSTSGFTNNILISPNSTSGLNSSPEVNDLRITPAAMSLPPWMNAHLQLYFNGPGVLSSYYIPGNGHVDFLGGSIDNYAYNVGAVNSTWGGTNSYIVFTPVKYGP